MPTHPHPPSQTTMATLKWRNPPTAAAPKNAAPPQTHHHPHHHHRHQHHPQQRMAAGVVVPKGEYDCYETATASAPGVRHHHHAANANGPPQSAVVYSSPIVPLPAPVPSCTTAQLAQSEEVEDDFNEITIQFDDGVQTLYVGPVEIVDKGGGKVNGADGGVTTSPPSAAPREVPEVRTSRVAIGETGVRPRERFQEERAIVTLEPVGGRAKSQSLPMFLQQQQQLQHQQQQLQHQQKIQQQFQMQQIQQQHQQKIQQQYQLQQIQQQQQQQLQQQQYQMQQIQHIQQQQQQQKKQQQLQHQIRQQQRAEKQQQQLKYEQQQQQQLKYEQQQRALKQQKIEQQHQLKLKQHSLQQHVQKLKESQQRHLQRQQQLTELQLTVSVQQQPVHQPLQASYHQGKPGGSNKRRQPAAVTHQQAVILQRQAQHQQQLLYQHPAIVQQQQPSIPPPPTQPVQPQPQALCFKQAPMLNFARAATTSTSSGSIAGSATAGSVGPKWPSLLEQYSAPPVRDDSASNVSRVASSEHLTIVPFAALRQKGSAAVPSRVSVLRSQPKPPAPAPSHLPVASAPSHHPVASAPSHLPPAPAVLAAPTVPPPSQYIIFPTIKQEPASEPDEPVASEPPSSASQQQHHHRESVQQDASMLVEAKPALLANVAALAAVAEDLITPAAVPVAIPVPVPAAASNGVELCPSPAATMAAVGTVATNTIIDQALEQNVTVAGAAAGVVCVAKDKKSDTTSDVVKRRDKEVLDHQVGPVAAAVVHETDAPPADGVVVVHVPPATAEAAAPQTILSSNSNQQQQQPATAAPVEALPFDGASSSPSTVTVLGGASPQPAAPEPLKRRRGRPPKAPKVVVSPPPAEAVTPSGQHSQATTPTESAASVDVRSSPPTAEGGCPVDEETPVKTYISVAALCKPVKQSDRKRIHLDHDEDNDAKRSLSVGGVREGQIKTDERPDEETVPSGAGATDAEGLVNGDGGVQTEIKVRRSPSPLKNDTPTESVRLVPADGLAIDVVTAGEKPPPEVVALEVEKESSPGRDSGIESVSDSTPAATVVVVVPTGGKKQQANRGRSKSSLSVVSEEDRAAAAEAVTGGDEDDGEKALKSTPSTTTHNEGPGEHNEARQEEQKEEEVEEDGSPKSLKRAIRTARKPSAKAKEAAEAAEVAQSVALFCGDEIQCCKCDMSFKTEAWYRKHLTNAHELNPSQITLLLQASQPGGGSEEDEKPPHPEAASPAGEEKAEVNGGAAETQLAEDGGGDDADGPAVKADRHRRTPKEKTSERRRSHSKKELPSASPASSSSVLVNGAAAAAGRSTNRKRSKSMISSEEGPGSSSSSSSKRGVAAAIKKQQAAAAASAAAAALQQNGGSGMAKKEVKVEQLRTPSGVADRQRTADTDSSDENSERAAKPLAALRAAGSSLLKSTKAVSPSAVSPSVPIDTKPPTTTTKQERYEPYDPYEGDPEKLTPFEEAKVTMLDPDATTGASHYRCTICDGQFSDIPAIKAHLSLVHAAIKRRSCEHCGRTFVQTGDLTRHVRIHTGHRPFKCPYANCNYAFISSGDLHKHVRRHNADAPCPKPHVCDECGKDFERSYDLKRHKTMHMKQQPGFQGIKCEVCGKVFARKDQYRAHTYRHMGVRPYQCEVCGKAFTDPSNYSKHSRLHELDGVEVVCDFCGRPFKNKSAISKHIFHCQQKTMSRKAAVKAAKQTMEKNGNGSSKARRVGVTAGFGKASASDATAGDVLVPVKKEPGRRQQNGGGRKAKRRRARSITPSSSSSSEEEDDDDDYDGEDYSDGSNDHGRSTKRDRRSNHKNGVSDSAT